MGKPVNTRTFPFICCNYLDEDKGKELYYPLFGNGLSDNRISDITLVHLPLGKDHKRLLVK